MSSLYEWIDEKHELATICTGKWSVQKLYGRVNDGKWEYAIARWRWGAPDYIHCHFYNGKVVKNEKSCLD